MSVDAVRTQTGSRPELAALPVNAPIGYVGSRVLPIMKIGVKAGTYYYTALDADVTAITTRTAGAAPTAQTIAEASAAWQALEHIQRYKMPWEMIPLIGGLAKADERGAKAAKRSVQNAVELAQLAVLIDGAGTSITSAIQDGIIDACDQVHRYNGKTAFVCDIGIYRWLIQQTEIQNLLVRTFGGMGMKESMSVPPAVFKATLQTLFMVDEVLIADDLFWPYAYRTTAAIVKLPPEGDESSFISDAEYGRTMMYWPTEGSDPYEINSFPDDDLRSNIFDATCWYSIEQMNSGAKVLLTLNSSGSTT
uniref:Capsid protein n=1 Tax=viral metagenome TaxID=1070528 RepID=A0A6M3LKJ1_9ZZZZ